MVSRQTISEQPSTSRKTISRDEGYIGDTVIEYDNANFTYDDSRLTYDGRILRTRETLTNTEVLTRKTIATPSSTVREIIKDQPTENRQTIT